jgi:hypothetical protein
MYNPRFRLLFAVLFVLLLCGTAQSTTTLLITVQDSIDNTTLPHATVFVNNANYARTNSYGQVYLTHAGLEDQNIQVSMNGYEDWSETVSKNITAIQVNLSRKSLTFTVTLFDSDTLDPISGARVNISADNTSQMKQTDVKGVAVFAVNGATLYTIDISAPNYESRSGIIDMGSENQEVQYKLLSGNSFSFVITDKDSGRAITDAEIRLSGVLAGDTDDRGILITPVTRGKTYTIEIKKDGYQSYTESKIIGESDAIYYATLSKAPVGAYVYVTDETKKPLNGTDVYINGTLSGTTNDYGRMNFPDLVIGDYLLEVRKSGYVTQSRLITVSSGQNQDYTFSLPYENAVLTIYVQDKNKKVLSNASVSIDGNPAGTTNDNGQVITRVSFNEEVNISVIKDGYSPASVKTQVIQGNATDSVTVLMDKSLDGGLITMILLGVVCIIVLIAVIRMFGNRKRRHIMRRNEI